MAHFTVRAEGLQAADNPYVATVISDEGGDFEFGRIRVQPPVDLSLDELDLLDGDVKVRLTPLVRTQEASVFDYSLGDTTSTLTYEERVRTTVESLVEDLGFCATEALFLTTFESEEKPTTRNNLNGS